MARQRPEKKPEPAPPATSRVLPLELQVGDRFADETGEWEIVSRPYMSGGGNTAPACVKGVDQPAVVEERSWRAARANRGETTMSMVARILRAIRQTRWLGPLMLAVLIGVLTGCATQPPTAAYNSTGFLMGLIHGIVVPFAFIGSLVSSDIRIYAFPNSGVWYDLGFLIGVSAWAGGGAAARGGSDPDE